MRKILSVFLKWTLILSGFIGLIVVLLDYINLTLAFDKAKPALAAYLEAYTGRDVRIDGEVELSVSLSPRLLARRIHIANPEGFGDNEDFFTASEVRVGITLLPLLSGELYFHEISASRAFVRLIRKKNGSTNWSLTSASAPANADDNNSARHGKDRIRRLTIKRFELTGITVLYSNEARDQSIEAQLDQLTINAEDPLKPQAEFGGSLQGYPYHFSLESEAFVTLLSAEPWNIHGSGEIAGSLTELEAKLQQTDNTISGTVTIGIKKVDIGKLLDTSGIISGQIAATDHVSIRASIRGSDPLELYQQAEIKLILGEGYWHIPSMKQAQNKVLSFNSASGFTSWNKPVVLTVDGKLAGEAVALEFSTNRLSEFFDDAQQLDIDLAGSIAGINITSKGTLDLPVDKQRVRMNLSLSGKELERLNPLLDTNFPPFNTFSISGNLVTSSTGFVLKSAKASIGDTQLQASVVVETNYAVPVWTINLVSNRIQLRDFAIDDRDIRQPDTDSEKAARQITHAKTYIEPLRQLQQAVHNPKMHLNLNLQVDELVSGEDRLGKARLQTHIRDDSFSIQNANIELPGGRIKASVSLATEDNFASGHLKLDIDKLDYGITTRLFNSDSQVNGMISTRIDLELQGGDFTRMLDNATGQFDIALWPINTKPAKILNLWATNLYLILLPELKKQESKVNCLVGLMDVENGIMKEEFFAIDTTRLWIYGNIRVEFKAQQLELSLFPQSKTARMFSLQSPIRARGTFDDIKLDINPLDMTFTYLSFITSPLHVPARWVFDDKPLEDGSAICEQYFDREYVRNLKMELEKRQQEEINKILDRD